LYRLKVRLHGVEIQELKLETGREYTFGRGETCDVQLKESTGISRVHFRLVEENGLWTAQVVSKFGDIVHGGNPERHLQLDIGTAFEVGPYYFVFLELEREREREQESDKSRSSTLPVAVGQSHAPADFPMDQPLYPAPEPVPDFEGNDDATNIVTSIPEAPYLRIVEPGDGGQSIRLEGRRWIAGREETANILLNDRKASRRQFELTSTPQGYFIRDLGSSNGTLLNSVPLAPDELKAIRSGDVIQVGSVLLYFEVRDPHFDNKLMVARPQGSFDNGIIVQNPYEMINYPMPTGPGGAIRVDRQGGGQWLERLDNIPVPFADNLDAAKKRKARFYMLIAIVFLPVILVLALLPDKPAAPPPRTNTAFAKLTPNQQKQVKELFLLASNSYMQQKYALTAGQLDKLHAILPEGYENSLAMSKECAEVRDQQQQYEELMKQKREREAIDRLVAKTIKDCDSLSRRTVDLNAITTCLRPALDQDPENSQVQEQIIRVKQRIEQNEINAKNREAHQKLVAKGEALYRKAFELEKDNEFLGALDAYRKHIDSAYPDPKGLKALSRKQVFSITKQISSMIDETLKAAEAAWGVQNYPEAFSAIGRAKKMDPQNLKVQELNAKYRRELNTKLREIYEESVISEGLGQIDDAKLRWNNIKKMDSPDGDYYKKASNKLKQYGAF